MRRRINRALLALGALLLLGSSSCSSNYTVGYGYTGDPYGDVFYSSPMDTGGFYGYPY